MRSCSSLRKTNDPLGRETVSVSAGRLERRRTSAKKRKKRKKETKERKRLGFSVFVALARGR